MFKEMVDAQAHGRVNVQGIQLTRWDEDNFLRFTASGDLSTQELGSKADRELLSNLPVIVGHDMVGIGIDTYDAGRLHIEARRFFDFADNGLLYGLADIHPAARESPQVIVCFVYEQHLSALV